MRILSLSTTDRGGGAEQVAWDLFTGLEERGHESWLVVGEKHTTHPRVVEIHASPHFDYRPFSDPDVQATWASQRHHRRLRGGEDFIHPYSRRLTELLPQPPDAVIAHNLHGGYFDLRSLPALTAQLPTIAVLHDYWMLTGHCAYPFDCERWKHGCGECPDLTIPPAIDFDGTRRNLRLKRAIYERSEITVCSPSERLLADVGASALLAGTNRTRCIPNGTDLELFRPGDPEEARRKLGLPQNIPIVLMIGKNIETNRFKDFECAMKCMRLFAEANRNAVFVALGGEEPLSKLEIGPVTLMSFPYTANRRRVADFFRSADVLLHATRQEVAPLVLGEALASGLPAVASRAGNAEQLLGQGGITVKPGDGSAHATALAQLLDDAELRHKMGVQARGRSEETGGRDAMITAYENLLSGMIKNSETNARI